MIALLVTAATAAVAAPCPDLSGTYHAALEDGATEQITLAQTRCERIVFTRGEMREIWILDGRCRPLPDTPELCVSRAFEGPLLVARGKLRIAGQETLIRRFEQKLRLEADGALSSHAVIHDLMGGLEEERRMRYTSIRTVPPPGPAVRKGKAPVRLDAR